MRIMLLLLLCLLTQVSLSGQGTFIPKHLDSVLQYLHNIHHFNGTVLYAENGKIQYKKALGVEDFRTGKPLNTHSAFNLASVSKQFFAMGILILTEQRKLHLDDPIQQYLPELPYPDITIQHLLQHTSGLPEYFDLFTLYKEALDTLTNEGLIQLYADTKPTLEFAPGERWAYCNTNYVLISAIIERVSGMNAATFMDKNIIKPLGLKDTYIYHLRMPEVPENHVVGYKEENGGSWLHDLINVDGVTGDGNMYSSVEDLWTWEQSWYTEKLVKKSTLELALKPCILKDGKTAPYGFGWGIVKPGEMYQHTGGWNGFANIICRDVKNKRCLVVLNSNGSGMYIPLVQAIFEHKPYKLPLTTLITNVQVIDGTGIPARAASVRILDETIEAVGALNPYPGEIVVDGQGKVLAPGFIDTHSHLAGSTEDYPEALAALNQGVTTIVSGQDGYGSWIDSIQVQLARKPIAINIATYTGQTALREMVMGGSDQLERSATQQEIDQMKVILRQEMKKGSLGLSTGLEYAGAYFSTHDEVIQLAKVTAEEKGRYISHLRSEDIALKEAISEIIEIGRQAKLPVQISHFKIALKDDWGTAPQLLAWLESARTEGIDITADCYPYVFWNSTLKVLFPKTDYNNPVSAQYAVDHTFDPAQSIVPRFAANPAYAGKTISEIAAMRQETPAQTLMGLIAEADAYEAAHPDATGIEAILGKSMLEEDVANILAWAHTNICSDGANGGHPRGYGSFTRVLGMYVREQKIMSLETAIQKMTSLAAAHVGIANRGILAPGYAADLVLFDPATVKDNASVQNPRALSDGILKVWVNGHCVYEDQKATKWYPGKFVGRKE
ncbi:MAG: serine hydrolase [Saprospiraceae bacterium]|nr:serine hydrolase [Saprospiraceae bacterium]